MVDYTSFLSPSPVGDYVNFSSVWYVLLKFTVQSIQLNQKRNSSVKKLTLLQPRYELFTHHVHSRHFEKWKESALKRPLWLNKNAHAPSWVTNQIVFNYNHSADRADVYMIPHGWWREERSVINRGFRRWENPILHSVTSSVAYIFFS